MRTALTLAGLAGCAETWQDMDPEQVCADVGFAISARTMECTDDPELAARRDAALGRDYRCTVERTEEEPIDRYYHCVVSVYDLGCDEVLAYGDDLDAWLASSWVCEVILSPKEGG